MLTLVTLLFLTGLFEKLPEATLAAIVIAAVVELVDIASLRRLWRVRTGRLARIYQVTSRADFMGAVTAMLGVLIFDTLPGLVIGIVRLPGPAARAHLPAAPGRPRAGREDRSRQTPVRRGSTPSATPTSSRCAGVLVVRVEASLFFGNADYVRDRVRALVGEMTPVPRLVVLDGETTPSVDVTAAAMLALLRTDLRRVGSDLALAHGIGQVRDVLTTAEPDGEPTIYASIEDALAATPPNCSRITGDAGQWPGADLWGATIDRRGAPWPR